MKLKNLFKRKQKESVMKKDKLDIKIMYHDKEMPKLKHIGGKNKSVMIDLYTSKEYNLEVGEYYLLDLGVSIKLPDGYYGFIVPRSSLFRKYGIIQANSCGIIDNSYCSSEDVYKFPAFIPLRQEDINKSIFNIFHPICEFDTNELKDPKDFENYINNVNTFRVVNIPKYTRICQLEIRQIMPDNEFNETDLSSEKKRGGFGSTDKKDK